MIDIKPIYNSGTISFVSNSESVLEKEIGSKIIKDPKGIIPNGIFKVFKFEKTRQLISLSSYLVLFFIQIILLTLFATIWNNFSWILYIPTSIFALIFLFLFSTTTLEFFSLKKSINTYRENLQNGSKLTPPFISNLYLKLNLRQVSSNWITTAILFYGTIATIIFWFLKDANWWIFEFDVWINNLGPSPSAITYTSIAILIFTLIIHIYLTIFRKKRILDIQAFFGNEVISETEVKKMAMERNKAYRRIFLLSILIILIIPFIIKIILKYTRKAA